MKALPMVSVIVPLYNEERVVRDLIANLGDLKGPYEVIFVDGGSTDDTCSIVEELLGGAAQDPSERLDNRVMRVSAPLGLGDEALSEREGKFHLVRSGKGRGTQLNVGARCSAGSILLFLHADSILPRDALEEVRRVTRTHQVGCFGLKFSPSGPLLGICQVLSNFRCFARRIMFGDQGIFITRELFFQMGGFPELPIMEDYQFSLNLRKRGFSIGRTKARLTTSSRRFGTTFLSQARTMWSMLRLRSRYRAGEPIDQIARAYREAR